MDRGGMRRRIAAGLLLLAAAPAANADAEARWYVQIDNDVPFGTDRWYTSGARLARVADGIEWGLAQEIYTPDAKHWTPGTIDRIPTARLLASVARHDTAPGVFQTVELALGVRGPAALGRQTTEAIHHLIPAPRVDWSRQPENRFDGQLALARSQAIGADLVKAHFGAVAGSQIAFAHAGVELRVGANRGMVSPLLRFAPTPPTAGASAEHGWNAYAGASARAVGRNELLALDYDPFGPALERRRGVARVVAGVAWTQPWGALAFELAQDSREFTAQAAPHRFGSLAIHVGF